MKIRNHKLDGVEFQKARHTGGIITPEIVILHDTASRLDKGNAARYLADNDAGVSVHFVVELDGTITQQVPTNRRASHAGQSSWHGRKWCNGFSIGIEIVNPGRMTWANKEHGLGRAWWGGLFEDGDDRLDVVEIATPQHGSGVWRSYPEAQIAAVEALLVALFRDIRSLKDITTHWYVSPGRKVDCNPLFPLEQMRARVLGREDPAEIEAEERSRQSGGMVRAISLSGLNMRRWPSFNPNIIASIPHNTEVPVLRAGIFEGRDWLRVFYAGQEGWIVKSHTEALELT